MLNLIPHQAYRIHIHIKKKKKFWNMQIYSSIFFHMLACQSVPGYQTAIESLTDIWRHARVQSGDHGLHRMLGFIQDCLHHGIPRHTLIEGDTHTDKDQCRALTSEQARPRQNYRTWTCRSQLKAKQMPCRVIRCRNLRNLNLSSCIPHFTFRTDVY